VGFAFDVYLFDEGVYASCAEEAGLRVRWAELVVPEEEGEDYWRAFKERPTFGVLVGWRVGDEVGDEVEG
jgi:hypothetical protein